MFENWFSTKCMALVGKNGRALSGEALEIAEEALSQAQQAGKKLWTDRNGYMYYKEQQLFANSKLLLDKTGNPVRICGRQVNNQAKFCSKCGSPAPGGWWRCGGCGRHIGNESQTCPHCGRSHNTGIRVDLADGRWKKAEDVFAERFEMSDVAPLLEKGLNIEESQCAILLEGGAVKDVLGAGFYQTADISEADQTGERSIVMVDNSEYCLYLTAESLRTKDDLAADLHATLVLRFDGSHAREFMQNLMGSSMFLHNGAVTAALAYDEIAHSVLHSMDDAIRSFCSNETISDLFRSADSRIRLENHIAGSLARNLASIGMIFVRLKGVDFESEVFSKLRDMSGQVEAKRQEIEFMLRADELANDATRREAMSEFEMEDYMKQLAHDKGIKDELRNQEIERLRKTWKNQQEKEAIEHESDLADLSQSRQQNRERAQAEFQEEMDDLHRRKELDRRIEEHKNAIEYTQLDNQVQSLKLEMEKKKTQAEQEATEGWLKIKQQKQAFNQNQKIEMMKAASGADLKAMLMAEDDPDKREQLMKMYEMEMQSKMTPELLLAAAAARGNAAAAEALSKMNQEQLAAIEKSKQENRDVYERMLQMNERMFNQTAAHLTQHTPVGNTTQIIK